MTYESIVKEVEDAFVQMAKKTIASVIEKDPVIGGCNAGNDVRFLKNIGNMPTVVMGPGSLEQCHVVNEYVSIEEYLQFILIYSKLILNWCKEE